MSKNNKKRKVIIDGRFLGKDFNGAIRYGSEIIKELDKLVENDNYIMLVPADTKITLQVKNIQQVVNKGKGLFGWYLRVIWYLIKHRGLYIDFMNGLAIWRPSIICQHDIYAFYDAFDNTFWYTFSRKIRAYFDALFASKIVTVSEYSKKTMLEKLPIKAEKIVVIYNAWQHLKTVDKETDILERLGIQSGNYYMFLGRLMKNKNIRWIFEVADRNPDDIFLIVGGLSDEKFSFYNGKNENIVYSGFIPDEDLKTLYGKCKAFLFPSFIEGFGIPPMEALYYGAPIIISNTSSLPEVYGEAAHYINPYKYDYDLDQLLHEPVTEPEKVLNRFSWQKSAREFYELIEYFRNT